MLRKILFMLVILATTTLTGCMAGYGYGMRPAYYGGGYGYRAPVYRPVAVYSPGPVYRVAPAVSVGRGWGYRGGRRGR